MGRRLQGDSRLSGEGLEDLDPLPLQESGNALAIHVERARRAVGPGHGNADHRAQGELANRAARLEVGVVQGVRDVEGPPLVEHAIEDGVAHVGDGGGVARRALPSARGHRDQPPQLIALQAIRAIGSSDVEGVDEDALEQFLDPADAVQGAGGLHEEQELAPAFLEDARPLLGALQSGDEIALLRRLHRPRSLGKQILRIGEVVGSFGFRVGRAHRASKGERRAQMCRSAGIR